MLWARLHAMAQLSWETPMGHQEDPWPFRLLFWLQHRCIWNSSCLQHLAGSVVWDCVQLPQRMVIITIPLYKAVLQPRLLHITPSHMLAPNHSVIIQCWGCCSWTFFVILESVTCHCQKGTQRRELFQKIETHWASCPKIPISVGQLITQSFDSVSQLNPF